MMKVEASLTTDAPWNHENRKDEMIAAKTLGIHVLDSPSKTTPLNRSSSEMGAATAVSNRYWTVQ